MDIATLGIRVDASGAITVLDQFGHAVTRVESQTNRLESGVKKLVAAFATYKVVQLARETLDLGARYETLGVVMGVVGNNIGKTQAQMDQFAQALQKSGISMIQSRENVIKMAEAHLDLSQATKLSAIAQNAAVIANRNSSETFGAMIHGIQAGQTDVLQTIGINVNFEKSYKELAKTLHTTKEGLSEHQKAQARANAVMGEGPTIARAYEAAMGTAGKQLNSTVRYLEDARVKISQAFQPAYTTLVFAYADALKWVGENSQSVAKWVTVMAAAVATAGTAWVVYTAVTKAAAIWTAAVAAAQTIATFVSLAQGVRKAADAMALLSITSAAAAGGGVKAWATVAATVAAITAGLIAYNKLAASADAATLAFVDKLNPLGITPEDTPGKASYDKEAASRAAEIVKQKALNAAFGQTDLALAKLAVLYDEAIQNAKDATEYHGKELASLMGLQRGLTNAKIAELELADARKQAAYDDQKRGEENTKFLDFAERISGTLKQYRDNVQGLTDAWGRATDTDPTRLLIPGFVDMKQLLKDIGLEIQTSLIDPMKKAEEAAKQMARRLVNEMQRAFSTFFENIFKGGVKSFSDLFLSIRDLFLKMIADMLAAKVVQKMASVLLGAFGIGGAIAADAKQLLAAQLQNTAADKQLAAAGMANKVPGAPGAPGLGSTLIAGAGIALAGGGVGYGLGRLAGGAAGGAVLGGIGGAATGAAIGSLGGPIGVATGAILGGLAGLAGGLLGGGAAAREHAAALKAAMEANRAAMEDFHAAATGTTGSLEELIRKVHETAAALRASTAAAMPHGGWGNSPAQNAAYAAAIAQIAADEAAYVARLAEEDRLKKQYFKEDLQVRLLRAQGHEAEANAMALKLQQEREYAAAVAAGADAQTLALLQTVQAAEVLKKAMDGLNTTVRNAPSGFKLASYINSFAAGRPWEPPLGMPYNPGRPSMPYPKGGITSGGTTVNIGTVSLSLPNVTTPEKVGPAFMTYIRKVQLQTVGPNAPLADAMEYAS